MVEQGRAGFFREITDKRIRRESFTSVAELEPAIDPYVPHHNLDPRPFIGPQGHPGQTNPRQSNLRRAREVNTDSSAHCASERLQASGPSRSQHERSSEGRVCALQKNCFRPIAPLWPLQLRMQTFN